MKKILIVLIAVIACGTYAFDLKEVDKDHNLAKVKKEQGLYIFMDCEPINDYDYLGTVKSNLGLSGQYTHVKNRLVKKIKKKYPHADAVIIMVNPGGADKADAIKFTE